MTKSVSAASFIVCLFALPMLGCTTSLQELPPLPGIQQENSPRQLSALPELPSITAEQQAITEFPELPGPELPQPALPQIAEFVEAQPPTVRQATDSTQAAVETDLAQAVTTPQPDTTEISAIEPLPVPDNPPPIPYEPISLNQGLYTDAQREVTLTTVSVTEYVTATEPAADLSPLPEPLDENPPQAQVAEAGATQEQQRESNDAQVTLVELAVVDTPQPAETSTDSSTLETESEARPSDPVLTFVANDLVNALTFIPSMGPAITTVSTSGTGSEFSELVISSMQQAGYSVDANSSETEKPLTTSFNQTTKTPESRELRVTMSIAGALIGRKYLIQNDKVAPMTSYFTRGIDPDLVDSSGPLISLR